MPEPRRFSLQGSAREKRPRILLILSLTAGKLVLKACPDEVKVGDSRFC